MQNEIAPLGAGLVQERNNLMCRLKHSGDQMFGSLVKKLVEERRQAKINVNEKSTKTVDVNADDSNQNLFKPPSARPWRIPPPRRHLLSELLPKFLPLLLHFKLKQEAFLNVALRIVFGSMLYLILLELFSSPVPLSRCIITF